MYTLGLYLRVGGGAAAAAARRLGHEADNLNPYYTKVINQWKCFSVAALVLMVYKWPLPVSILVQLKSVMYKVRGRNGPSLLENYLLLGFTGRLRSVGW
jgi:hypothetical protein